MAKFFLIGEVGDEGMWLVDVDAKSVERIPESEAAGFDRSDDAILRGVNLALVSESRTGPSAHSRVNVAVASESRTGPSAHSRVNLAVASESRTGPSAHNRLQVGV